MRKAQTCSQTTIYNYQHGNTSGARRLWPGREQVNECVIDVVVSNNRSLSSRSSSSSISLWSSVGHVFWEYTSSH